jgi:hypothetical protein
MLVGQTGVFHQRMHRSLHIIIFASDLWASCHSPQDGNALL